MPTLEQIADDDALLEVARKAIEDVLVEFRESRVSRPRGNGLVIRERDGSPSEAIRLGPEQAVMIGLNAIAKHLKSASMYEETWITYRLALLIWCYAEGAEYDSAVSWSSDAWAYRWRWHRPRLYRSVIRAARWVSRIAWKVIRMHDERQRRTPCPNASN